MSLVDELLAVQAKKGPDCSVGVALDHLPPDIDRAELEEAIDNPLIRFTTIAAWAKNHDLTLKPEALSRHRSKACRCRV